MRVSPLKTGTRLRIEDSQETKTLVAALGKPKDNKWLEGWIEKRFIQPVGDG